MMRPVVLLLFTFFTACCSAQDTLLSNKALAEQQIMQLHEGTLVVRLKTYSKSVAAYREAGKTKLADKLTNKYYTINLFLMKAFLENMNFCKVLFILAEDSRKLVAHQAVTFLNEKMTADTSAPALLKGPVFLAEFGELMSNDRTSDKSFLVKHTEATSSGGTTSAIFISDTTLTQLNEPFPFYSLVSVVDEALPAIAPGINGAPVDTNTWQIQGTNSAPRARVNPIWKKDIYERAVKHLNKKLIEYYCKVNQRMGKYISDDPYEWERKNPNGDVESRLKTLIAEITKLQEGEVQIHYYGH